MHSRCGYRYPGRSASRRALRPHEPRPYRRLANRLTGRPDKYQSGALHCIGKIRVLGEEAIAWMYGVHAGVGGGTD